MTFDKKNNLTGWLVFAVAFLVYFFTVAPTASFWDCGEFIACSNELEVTHPPGAPLFLLLGRIFAMLSFGNAQNVAFMVNLISVIASAGTAMLTTWITTALIRKLSVNEDFEDNIREMGILFAGAIAGLVCTFADSIWFNAVEAEVYALSLFFTALVFWLMLKWEKRADEPHNLRWIILIAYMMGLSVGVHLLNLLTIPGLALIYYFRKYPFSWQGLAATLGISVVVLVVIQYGILQYSFSLAWEFEKIFTGTITRSGQDRGGMGMPMGTGSAILTGFIILIVTGLLKYSQDKGKTILNTVVLCFVVITLGFSSYALIFVRSGANPPIDMNNPENIQTFLSYMKREQYGDRPLFRGPLYSTLPKVDEEGRAIFKEEGMRYMLLEGKKKYVEDEPKSDYDYNSEDLVFFPRMHSSQEHHINSKPFGYANYVRRKGENKSPYEHKPTAGEDLAFAWEYQFAHMYLRYFMWNFVGRESDIQDSGWEDGLFLNGGKTNNKGQNHFFFLPLLLGIMGMLWHYSQSRKDALMLGLMFFFTGVAIIIYLNQTPEQPRERDYSYAGSFQTFAIWVGMGVMFLIDLLRKHKWATWAAGSVAFLSPLVMCAEGWDDHTRKGRWVDVEFAKNMLDSCAPNAILFTGGDNDTFPLWYAQEVEGYRTDVRVVNLELFVSDWYIDQAKRKVNDSEAFPLDMKHEDYAGEKNIVYRDYKSRIFSYPVNKATLAKTSGIRPELAAMAQDTFKWTYKTGGYILRKDSAIINLVRNIANAGWNRPIYFGNTLPISSYQQLTNYFQMEGLAYRVTPILRDSTTANHYQTGRIDQVKMEENLFKKFKYTGLNDPATNLDEHVRNLIIGNYRNAFFALANSYAEQGLRDELQIAMIADGKAEGDTLALKKSLETKKAKIREIMQFSQKVLPYSVCEPGIQYLGMTANMYYNLQMKDMAQENMKQIEALSLPRLRAYGQDFMRSQTAKTHFSSVLMAIQYYVESGDNASAEKLATELQKATGNDQGFMVIKQMKEELKKPQ